MARRHGDPLAGATEQRRRWHDIDIRPTFYEMWHTVVGRAGTTVNDFVARVAATNIPARHFSQRWRQAIAGCNGNP
jgi:hypothetical protein